ncbi:tRNA methyltransferase, partial [Baffinella frigidus]
VLDALSATGLRALRYAQEVPGVGTIVANDIDPVAMEMISANMKLNNISSDRIEMSEGDACAVMLANAGRGALFDVIDLDPFGSAAPMLSSSLHAISHGGMLAVTCTDMRVLVGNQPEAYGAMPCKAPYSKELAIRILLQSLQNAATPLGKVVEPMLCLSIDFYVRVFVRVRFDRRAVQRACINSGMVYNCRACDTPYLQAL